VDNFYAFFPRLWINSEIHRNHGVLSPEIVDNRVENVDFPVDDALHIHLYYTFFRHGFDADYKN